MKCKLGDYIRIKHGFAFKGEYITAENNGVVLVTPGNFEIGGGFKEDKCKFFNGDYPKEYVLSPYDLIVTMTDLSKQGDTLGYSALVPKTNRVYLHNQRIGLVDVYNPKADKMFIYWLMRTQKYQKTIVATSSGSTVKHTSPSRIYDVEVDLPPIDVQKKIAAILSALDEKIAINRAINDNLEETAQSLFQEQFAAFYNENELPDGYSIATLDSLCSIKGGKRLPADGELLDTPTAHPYIRVRDLGSNRYVCLTNQFQYIDEETHSAISRYIVNTNDIVISIVGTIGLIGKIHTSLNNANLTENCVKLANIHTVTPDYLYYTLCYKKQIKEIELLTVGAVQSKLPMYNIQSMKILVPPAEVIEDFQHKFDIFNEQIEANTIEIQRLYELQSVLLAKLAY